MKLERTYLYIGYHATEPFAKLGTSKNPRTRLDGLKQKFNYDKTIYSIGGATFLDACENAIKGVYWSSRTAKFTGSGYTEWYPIELIPEIINFLKTQMGLDLWYPLRGIKDTSKTVGKFTGSYGDKWELHEINGILSLGGSDVDWEFREFDLSFFSNKDIICHNWIPWVLNTEEYKELFEVLIKLGYCDFTREYARVIKEMSTPYIK